MLSTLLQPLAAGLLVAAAATPALILLARRRGWVSRPRDDRWGARSTPLLGGVALLLGALAAWTVTGPGLPPAHLAALLAIAALGLVDDLWWEMRPHHKLIGQVAVAALLLFSGVRWAGLPDWLAVPLTLLWLVGIPNAVNLLDNMDGLAAGVVALAAASLGGFALLDGRPEAAILAFGLAGACAGFLLFNFHPARVYMGDCGSQFLGLALALLALHGPGSTAPNLLLSLAVPVAVLAVPIFDTTLVAVTRAWHGRPILPGARDHASHRLVALGLSERATALLLYLLTAVFGGLALLATQLPLPTVSLVGVALAAVLVTLGIFLALVRSYPESAPLPANTRVLPGMLLYKRQLVQVIADLLLAAFAFVAAHVLRFEGELPAYFQPFIWNALPVVLACRVVGMAACRGYRGIWRYAGMADVVSAAGGAAAGSALLALVLGLLTGYTGLSRAALVTDWLLFTVLAVTARMSYHLLRQLFSMVPARQGTPVLLLGAGPETRSFIERLSDPTLAERAHLLGILDEDPTHHGSLVNGVPVLGPLDAVEAALRQDPGAVCVLTVPPHSPEGARILAHCRERQIPVYRDLQEPLFLPSGTASGEPSPLLAGGGGA